MLESTERTVKSVARSVIAEYGLNWTLEDIIDDGSTRCTVRFENQDGGRAALSVDLEEIDRHYGKVTDKGVSEELRKSLQLLGITPSR
jgi:hypothetical protein